MADRSKANPHGFPGVDGNVTIGGWVEITPSDTEDLPDYPAQIWVGGTGNINMADHEGNTLVLHGFPVGAHNISPKRVLATNTTATNLRALFPRR